MAQPNLAQRLGYPPDQRLLIINCDDLGSSRSANRAIYHALSHGCATSATLMVPCPWARKAADMLRAFPLGVHLTLTSEYRRYRWRGLTNGASLHDGDGWLPTTTSAAVRQITKGDARAECCAQIEAALWGIDVTHLDTHMNVLQARADLHELYLELAEAFRLPIRILPPEYAGDRTLHVREEAARRGLLGNDHLVYPWPRRTREVFADEVLKLPPGVCEIFAHPVLDGDELRAYDPVYAHIRAHDADCLTDPTVLALLDRHRINRISYRVLRDLQRAG